jgi:chemotaxis protein CheD
MISATAINTATKVGMGQIAVARAPGMFDTVLGSCIGLALYHRRLHVGALAHIVLPESAGREGSPGKFVDTALPHLLQLLAAQGANQAGLTAKIAGGASMFSASGPMQIGEANGAAVLKALAKLNIPVVGQHLGGPKGRRIEFDCTDGRLRVHIAGSPTVEI